VGEGAVIYAAYPNEPWPGSAAVITSRVHVYKGAWNAQRCLLGKAVSHISAFLSDQVEWSPKRLRANAEIAFIGSYVLGMGFVLSLEDVRSLLSEDIKNADVLFPYLNGDDINSSPTQVPGRWVINFFDWSEEKAKEYPLLYSRLFEKVKPERDKNNRAKYRDRWWHYAEAVPNLYHVIGRGDSFVKHPECYFSGGVKPEKLLVSARVTKYFNPVVVSNDCVFHEKVVVTRFGESELAFFNSSLVDHWVRKQSSTLGGTLNIAPSDAIETLPLPANNGKCSGALKELSARYDSVRKLALVTKNIGLTKFYNMFHDSTCVDSFIRELREIQREVDVEVSRSYGWGDIDLGHDFHEVSYLPEHDRIRYTISDSARVEVLRRLSELNHQRYEEELAHGLHVVGARRAPARTLCATRATHAVRSQSGLDFNAEAAVTVSGEPPTAKILQFLGANRGWHAKSDILAATGISDGQWNVAITDLIAGNKVERQGERRGARYRDKRQGIQ